MYKLWNHTKSVCSSGQRILNRVDQYCNERMQAHPAHVAAVREKTILTSLRHNMASHPDEAYYSRQYWHWIEKSLKSWMSKTDPAREILIIDLGCGQGRFSLPLARWCTENGEGKVIGVDLSAPAIDYAKRMANEEGVAKRVEFVESDILEYIMKQECDVCHIVLCNEVLYMISEYERVLKEVERVLVPGGLFLVGFRSRYYNILRAIIGQKWGDVRMFLRSSEGYPWGPYKKYCWHNMDGIREVLSKYGFEVQSSRGIGVCSGVEGDPFSRIVQPSLLTSDAQDELINVELVLADEFANCGRYIFAEAIKRQ